MILLALSLSLSSETLVIVSNFVLAFSTILLWAASEREQHQTIKAIAKGNNALVRYIVRVLKGSSSQTK